MKMKMNQRIDESMKQSIDDEVIEGDWLGGYIVLYYCDSASVRVASIYLPTAVVIASKHCISKTGNGRFWTWQRSRPLPTSGGGLRTRLSRHDRGSFTGSLERMGEEFGQGGATMKSKPRFLDAKDHQL